MCCSHQCPTSRGGLSEAITMHPDGPKIESMAAQRAPNDPQRTSKRVDRLDNPAGFNTVEHVHSITQQAPIPLLKMKWLKTKWLKTKTEWLQTKWLKTKWLKTKWFKNEMVKTK